MDKDLLANSNTSANQVASDQLVAKTHLNPNYNSNQGSSSGSIIRQSSNWSTNKGWSSKIKQLLGNGFQRRTTTQDESDNYRTHRTFKAAWTWAVDINARQSQWACPSGSWWSISHYKMSRQVFTLARSPTKDPTYGSKFRWSSNRSTNEGSTSMRRSISISMTLILEISPVYLEISTEYKSTWSWSIRVCAVVPSFFFVSIVSSEMRSSVASNVTSLLPPRLTPCTPRITHEPVHWLNISSDRKSVGLNAETY